MDAEQLQPPSPRPPTWTYPDVAMVSVFAVAGQFLLYIGGSLTVLLLRDAARVTISDKWTTHAAFVLPLQLAWWGLVFWVIYRVVRARDPRPFREAVGWIRPPFPVSACLAGGILLALSVAAVSRVLPLPHHRLPMEQLFLNPASALMMAAFGVLIAPAIEELLFRGFLYPVMERAHGARVAVLATGCLFSALHAPQYGWAWQNLLLLTYVGLVFGAVRAVSGSLVPSTLVHAAYNLTLFGGLYVSSNRFQDL